MAASLSAPPEEWFTDQLDALSRRVTSAREQGAAQDVEALVQDLETAVEELRIAEEEVRSQGEQIHRLLQSTDMLRWRYERLTAALPVAVVTTDRHGRLRSVNPSAAALFGLRIDHLLRKPIFVFLDEPDRHTLRQALTEATHGRTPHPGGVTLRTRQGQQHVVAYAGLASGQDREISWMFLERDPAASIDAERPEETADPAAGLPSALLALSALSARGVDVGEVLQDAAHVCATVLGADAEAGIDVGHPLAPDGVATTSESLQALGGWQIQAGEGPAVMAYTSGEIVSAPDVLHDDRWPRLQRAAGPDPAQVTSCLSVPLVTSEGAAGVLTVAVRGEPFSPTIRNVVEVLGAAVASLIQESGLRSAMQTLVDEMRSALSSRAMIDQAKGVVMADQHCTADEAFRHLVMLSNTTHRKLRDVAQAIVDQAEH